MTEKIRPSGCGGEKCVELKSRWCEYMEGKVPILDGVCLKAGCNLRTGGSEERPENCDATIIVSHGYCTKLNRVVRYVFERGWNNELILFCKEHCGNEDY